MDATLQRAATFRAIRDLAYATDAAHDGPELMRTGRGNCVAKAHLLARRLGELGLATQIVRWEYRLPATPDPIILGLGTDRDLHTAVEVHVDGHWTLVDATVDAPLASLGWTVTDWDGTATSTAPAFEPVGPSWVVGEDDAAIEDAARRITGAIDPQGALAYRTAFASTIDEARHAAPLTVRPAVPDDAMGLAGVHIHAWQWAYRGQVPDEVLDRMHPGPRAERWYSALLDDPSGMFVAELGGAIVGFLGASAMRDDDLPGIGEIGAVYVLRHALARGIGAALWDAGMQHLRDAGFAEVALWSLESNQLGRRFYDRMGLTPDGTSRRETIGNGSTSIRLRGRIPTAPDSRRDRYTARSTSTARSD